LHVIKNIADTSNTAHSTNSHCIITRRTAIIRAVTTAYRGDKKVEGNGESRRGWELQGVVANTNESDGLE